MSTPEIITDRLILRRWLPADRAPFAAMNADPEVMEFFASTADEAASDAFADRIEAAFDRDGYGLYAVEVDGDFAGFTGLSPLPFRDELEIGWRLARRFWGHGFATEAAIAVLERAFGDLGIDEVVSITSVRNVRSERVMQRIGLTRNPAEDFDHPNLPEGHPLRPHVLYRARAGEWPSAR